MRINIQFTHLTEKKADEGEGRIWVGRGEVCPPSMWSIQIQKSSNIKTKLGFKTRWGAFEKSNGAQVRKMGREKKKVEKVLPY